MDPKSTFIKRFGDLVGLLRADPGNDAAQELALSAAAAAVADAPLRIESGAEGRTVPDDLSLQGRMLARQVESLSIAAGVPPGELQALARALAHDVTPIAASAHIEVELVRLLAPPSDPPDGGHDRPAGGGPESARQLPAVNRRSGIERRQSDERRRSFHGRRSGSERRHGNDRRIQGERRLFLLNDQRAEIGRLLAALARSCRLHAWEDVFHDLHALVQLEPRVPLADRGRFASQVRGAVPRAAIEALVVLAERDYVVREGAAEVLRWIGLDAVAVILDHLRLGEALGVRAFFYEVVARVPDSYAMVVPMLGSSSLHEVRHGAALLGRIGQAEAVEVLQPLLAHPDELVRSAVVHALGKLHTGRAAGALREALRHPSSRTRVAAAVAIAEWRGGSLAPVLAGALERERDRDAWQAMVSSLGRIGTPEACSALATVARTKRSILRGGGYTTSQRLAAVTALGLAETDAGHATLERLAREDGGVVSYAADRLLQAAGLRVG